MAIDVDRQGTRVTVTWKPSGGTKGGQAFRRRPGLSDDACKKLALRK